MEKSSHLGGQMVVLRQIAEAGIFAFEGQFDRAGRAVALLADDDFGLAVGRSISICQVRNSGVPSRGCLFFR